MTTAFQINAFQGNAFQIDAIIPDVVGRVGGDDAPSAIWWRPEKDHEWPDLAGDVLTSVYAAVQELSGEDEPPTVAAVVAKVQPREFSLPPQIDMAYFAEQLRVAIAEAIAAWQEQEDEEAAVMLLLH